MARLLSIIASSLLLANHVMACATVSGGRAVLLSHENVIMVWDKANGMQHFIRQANFKSGEKNFGFIVPTPTEPTFSVADTEAFSRLYRLIPLHSAKKSARPAAWTVSSPRGGVQVLKTDQVGDYQATVVKATDGKALNDWLKKNEFVSRPSLTAWLDNYAKKQWVFTALKYKADSNARTETKAIRISFKTDKPYYPYKMPADKDQAGNKHSLKLYFVAATGVEAKYDKSSEVWGARREWSGPLPEAQRPLLAKELGLSETDIPANAQVTIFDNPGKEDDYDEDLVFMATSSAGPFMFGGIALVLVGGWLMVQRNRRKFVLSPA